MVHIKTEPVWHPARGLYLSGVSAALRDWLIDPSSLTQRLISVSNGEFAVTLLSQGWERPLLSEARILKTTPHHYAFVRKVQLTCKGVPWVYARTVIPAKTAKGRLRSLTRLGQRPLGAVLFSHRKLRRDALQIAKITPDIAFYSAAMMSAFNVRTDAIWGRRSLFYLYNEPLLVNEIFLPPVSVAHV